MAAAQAERGVRSSVIRLSPSVNSENIKHGFVPSLIQMAEAKGKSAYVGEGFNRWPAVHQKDAANLYRLVVESAKPGTRLHRASEEGIPFKQIAEAIGDHLNIPTESISQEEANDHFNFLADFVQLDNPTSSALTQEWFGWEPVGPKLIDDITEGRYKI
jgi:nucleoside-diphosphate-sugar epimerase